MNHTCQSFLLQIPSLSHLAYRFSPLLFRPHSRLVEFLLRLFASRALPVVGQVVERDAVVLGGIVNIAADRADVFAARFHIAEIDLRQNGRDRIVKIDHTICFKIFISLRSVRSAVNRRVIPNKITNTVKRFARRLYILEHHRKLVLVQRFVHICDVPVKHIEQTVAFHDHDAVSVGVTFGFDEINPARDLLTLGEVVIRAVRIFYGHDIIKSFELLGGYFLRADVDLCVREGLQLSGMVVVLVRQKYLRDLFRLVAERGERFHIAADIFSGENRTVLVRHFLRHSGRESRVNENDLIAGVDQIILQTAAIAYVLVELVYAVLAAEDERLGVKPVFSEFYRFDLHVYTSVWGSQYEFDVDYLKRQFEDYLNCTNSDNVLIPIVEYEGWKYTYGLAYYDFLIEHIKNVINKTTAPDRRLFTVLLDHKTGMELRIRYLKEHRFIIDDDSLEETATKLKQETTILLNQFLKANMIEDQKREALYRKMINSLSLLKNEDSEFTQKLLDALH